MYRNNYNISLIVSQQKFCAFVTNLRDNATLKKSWKKYSRTIVRSVPISQIRHHRPRFLLAGGSSVLNPERPDPFPLLHRLNAIIILATIGGIRQHHDCSIIRFCLRICVCVVLLGVVVGIAERAAWRQQTLQQVCTPRYGAYSKSEHKG